MKRTRLRTTLLLMLPFVACLIGLVGAYACLVDSRSRTAGAASLSLTPGIPRPDHVVIVIEENHSYSQIIGSNSAPYINSLAQQNALFTNSYATEHPSEPNYLDLFSGSNQGVTDDSCPHTFSTANLGSEVIAAGLTFAGYSEDLPGPGSQVCSSGAYVRKHSPWVNFSNVPAATNLPFTSFPSDYSTLPTISFVIPNENNDMHDGTIQQGDTWLQAHLDGYVQWAQTHNSLFILTWDEDDFTNVNQIVTIFGGSMVVGGQYSETINHFNLLRTLEDMYGLPYAGSSGGYQPIVDVWSGANPASPTPTRTPTTLTPIPTQTATGTPGTSIVGHVTWQGPPAQPNSRQQLPVTLTLCASGTPVTIGATTDSSGFFTVTASLPAGSYNWRAKGPKYLATSGTALLAQGTNQVEMGVQRAGDVDTAHDDLVNTTDFMNLKRVFGTASTVGDLNNDGVTNTFDVILLKGNFGEAGAAANCP